VLLGACHFLLASIVELFNDAQDMAMTVEQSIATPLKCTISDLEICLIGSANPVSKQEEIFDLSVNIRFDDEVNRELVKLLMPLGLTIKTTFLLKDVKSKQENYLGEVLLTTVSDTSIYTPRLLVQNSAISFQSSDLVLTAIVRVGNSPFCIPSILRGTLEKPLTVEATVAAAQPLDHSLDQKTKPNPDSELVVTKAKPSRRKTIATQ
jgi:hypothetical protein